MLARMLVKDIILIGIVAIDFIQLQISVCISIEIQLFTHFDLFKKASFILNCGALGR